jgi:hypothetical protein
MGLSKPFHHRVMAPGIRFMIDRTRRVNRLTLDYAIGAAIVALLPFEGTFFLEIKLLITAGLIWKMMRDIGRIWGRPRSRQTLAIAFKLLRTIVAISAALMAWLTLVCIGLLFFPPIRTFALAAALFTLTWALGRTSNQFHVTAMTYHIDRAALKRALQDDQRRRLS